MLVRLRQEVQALPRAGGVAAHSLRNFMAIRVVEIDLGLVSDSASFHEVFKVKLGFPDYYGANKDAWADCMFDLDTPPATPSGSRVRSG
jgi:hypothetical protein